MQTVEAVKNSDSTTLVKVVMLMGNAFLANPIKVGFAGLMLLFGWQVTAGQKELAREIRAGYEQLDSRHALASSKAHDDFARALERLSGKLDENTRAILSRGK